jgi:predicted phage terminase large subunit-like protein
MTQLNSNVIAGFVRTVLSSRFETPVATPDFHKEAWDICCSKYTHVAIAAPRNHAKTTGITIAYGLATLMFRERKFMILVSDTESQATMFLSSFKEHLQDNEALVDLFNLRRDENGKVLFIKDTESDIIVQFKDGHKFRIIAKGAEQKLRGLNWNGSRPDIILCDDIENDELVLNKERREKMKRWFNSALIPCLSSHGIIRIVGTILHMDSLLERLMPKQWDKWTHDTALKLYSEKLTGGWFSIKYRAHNADFSRILWPDRWPKEKLKQTRERYISQGIPDAYSQEYLNYPVDESVAYYKRKDFLETKDEHRQQKLHIYITVDLAISESEKADYSVFIIAGVDEYKRIFILDVIRDRLDGREIVDTLINLQRVYDPEIVGIEEMQVSKSIGPFLREEMLKTGVFLNIKQLKHGGKDKIARGRSMQARVRAHTIFFDKSADWYQTFEDECTRFPRDTHDDQVDAFSYLGLMLDSLVEAPTPHEIEDELYNDELQLSGYGYAGASTVTGY